MTAGLWLFLFRTLSAFFPRKAQLEPRRDPEVLLQQAQTEMRENQAKNRERAVQAITQKNNLQAELDKTQKIVDNLQAKAALAAREDDAVSERQLLVEAKAYQTILARIQSALDRAVSTVEMIKVAVRREEDRLRSRTAEMMTAETEWKLGQISASLQLLAAQDSPNPNSAQGKWDAVLNQIEWTRDALWQEAQAAVAMGDYTMAIRLLTEQQNLENAIVLGHSRA